MPDLNNFELHILTKFPLSSYKNGDCLLVGYKAMNGDVIYWNRGDIIIFNSKGNLIFHSLSYPLFRTDVAEITKTNWFPVTIHTNVGVFLLGNKIESLYS